MEQVRLVEVPEKDSIELHVKGEFIVGFSLKEFKYQQSNNQTGMLCHMLRYAVQAGKDIRSEEVTKILTGRV